VAEPAGMAINEKGLPGEKANQNPLDRVTMQIPARD
jgi:hypothetical protein